MSSDDKEVREQIGAFVHEAIGMLLTAGEQMHFAVHPLDVLTPDGMRRAFVLVTVNEALVRQFEAGLQQVLKAMREQQEGGHGQ